MDALLQFQNPIDKKHEIFERTASENEKMTTTATAGKSTTNQSEFYEETEKQFKAVSVSNLTSFFLT